MSDLITPIENFGLIESPFCIKEIDDIINSLHLGKSLGPDGFNSKLIKRSWPIICNDFYGLCHEFYNHRICL